MTEPRELVQGTVYRYPRAEHVDSATVDGLPNFYWHTSTADIAKAKLERGISRLGPVSAGDRMRTPAILVRSTPWKAGTSDNPWHDSFDANRSVIRYYGDNKIDGATSEVKEQDPADVLGNKRMLEAHYAQASDDAVERAASAPILFFTGVPVGGRAKGNVRFDGLGIVTATQLVRQVDDVTGLSYPNLLFEISLLDLSVDRDRISWEWISARRRAGDRSTADDRAPVSWLRWVDDGHGALESVRLRHWHVEPVSPTGGVN